jgi:hypothetical protein
MPSKAAPPETVRIINPNRLYVAFGPYLTGVEYEVTREMAARLAPRGFVVVPAATPTAHAPAED